MRLPLPIPFALASALACAGGASAQDGSVTYRCPGNDYKNTISAKEAEKLGCKKLEGAPVTVIQMTKPRPQGGAAVPAAATGSGPNKVDPQAQRARDSDARKILETELRTEEDSLAALKREFNNGQPERLGNEQNYQKYIDRVEQLRAAITRKEADVAAIKRELQKLPAAPVLPL